MNFISRHKAKEDIAFRALRAYLRALEPREQPAVIRGARERRVPRLRGFTFESSASVPRVGVRQFSSIGVSLELPE